MPSASACENALRKRSAGPRASARRKKTKLNGVNRVHFQWLLTLSSYNLIRMRNIAVAVPG